MSEKREFEKVYKKYFDYVYYFIFRRVAEPADAADVAHDTFLAAWKAWSTYDEERKPKNWLIGIAVHKINDYLRRKYRFADTFIHAEVDNLSANETSSEISLKQKKYKNLLQELIDELKPREKNFINLRFKKNMTIAEVAKELGITSNNAKVIQHRLIKKLRQTWQLRSSKV